MAEIHNKVVLTGRVKKLEDDIEKLNKADENEGEILKRILSLEERIIRILEEQQTTLKLLADPESYHRWLKEQEGLKQSAASQAKNSPK